MKFVLSIDCNNAAFENLEVELKRILKIVANEVGYGAGSMTLRDINGNIVGHANLEEAPDAI